MQDAKPVRGCGIAGHAHLNPLVIYPQHPKLLKLELTEKHSRLSDSTTQWWLAPSAAAHTSLVFYCPLHFPQQ